MEKINIECFLIDNDGNEESVDLETIRITSDTLAVIVSHLDKYIYIFKGKNTSTRQKFAGARSASMKRLTFSFKIKHIEEEFGIDTSFKPILEYLGGIRTKLKDEVKFPKSASKKHKNVITAMIENAPIENSTCEFMFTISEYFEIDGFNKNDLSDGNFELIKPKVLPEHLFPADAYQPRFIVDNNKIVGMELWKKKKDEGINNP